MNRTLALALSALAAAVLPGAAVAANCATVTASPASPAIPTWDPLNGPDQEASFTVTITRTSNQSRSVRLIFVDADSTATPTRVGANGPRYEIINVSDGGTRISYPQGTQIASLSLPTAKFAGQGTATVDLKVRILANTSVQEDFVGGTIYSEALRYSAQCFRTNGNDNGIDNAAASNLLVNLTIPKLLSIVTAGPATIDFQNFTTDQQQALIKIRSTSTLNVSATTTNGGRLKLGASTAQNAVIPYDMRFGLPTTRPLPKLIIGQTLNATRAGVAGKDYALRLSLSDGVPSGKLAGSYSDTITLTITPGT